MTDTELREKVARVIGQAVGGWNSETRAITKVADALMPLIREAQAAAWSEGAAYAAVELGAINTEEVPWEAPGENPYREDR